MKVFGLEISVLVAKGQVGWAVCSALETIALLKVMVAVMGLWRMPVSGLHCFSPELRVVGLALPI
jgi:hypothetical protein